MSGPATSAATTATTNALFRTLGFKTNKEAAAYFSR